MLFFKSLFALYKTKNFQWKNLKNELQCITVSWYEQNTGKFNIWNICSYLSKFWFCNFSNTLNTARFTLLKDHIIKLIPQEAILAAVQNETESQALRWTAADTICPICMTLNFYIEKFAVSPHHMLVSCTNWWLF